MELTLQDVIDALIADKTLFQRGVIVPGGGLDVEEIVLEVEMRGDVVVPRDDGSIHIYSFA